MNKIRNRIYAVVALFVTFFTFSVNIYSQELISRINANEKNFFIPTVTKVANIRYDEYYCGVSHTLVKSHTSSSNLISSNIYKDWNNISIREVSGVIPVDKNKIDLRHFVMPTSHRKITSNYGKRWGRMHEGLDIKAYIGDTIVSAFSGRVRIVKYNGTGYGYYVVVRHDNGLETLYGHLSKQIVKENDYVSAGQVIGLAGNSGRSSGSHLHFECRLLGLTINPSDIFDFEHQDIVNDYYILKK